MKKELVDSERREQDLEEQLEVAEAELSNLRDTIDELESSLGNNAATIMMLREELELAEADKDQLRETVASKESSLNEACEELSNLRSHMSSQSETVENVEREAQEKIEAMNQEYEYKMEKLRMEIHEKRAQCELLKSRSDNMDEQISSFTELLTKAQAKSEEEINLVS